MRFLITELVHRKVVIKTGSNCHCHLDQPKLPLACKPYLTDLLSGWVCCSPFPRLNRTGDAYSLLHPNLSARLWLVEGIAHLGVGFFRGIISTHFLSYCLFVFVTFNYVVNVLLCFGSKWSLKCVNMDHHTESNWILELLMATDIE